MAKKVEHFDILGKNVEEGCCVAVADGTNSLKLCTVEKLNAKTIKVRPFKKDYTLNKYARESIVVDSSDLTIYLLKNQ